MATEHYLLCNVPICNGDPNPNYKDEVIYYPGEPVCQRKPFKRFQVIQKRINDSFRKGGLQDTDGFTASQLEASSY